MIILHGALVQNRFHLWGETPRDSAAPKPTPKGRKQKTKRTDLREFPYDPGTAAVLHKLFEAGLEFADKDQNSLSVWLPTVGSVPLASSPLIATPPESTQSASLQPWAASSMLLQPGDAVELLCRCVDQELLAPGLIIGKDLTYWAAAMRLASGMVARQQFLPALARTGDSYRACWEPVFAGGDYERVLKFAAAMPHQCRAASFDSASDSASPPNVSSVSALSGFIGYTMDYLVRTGAGTAAERGPSAQPRSSQGAKFVHESIHDQWIEALSSNESVMKGERAELDRLALQIAEWRRPISISTATPFRLCFRLEEPDGNADPTPAAANGASWKLRYLLQDVSDPSLLLPAEVAWKSRNAKSSLFKRRGFNAPEYLLSALGLAATLCSRIENSLRAPAPNSCELDSTEAHHFLSEQAWLLEQAGFTIFLPAWWTRKGPKLRLGARAVVKSPKLQGGAGLSLDQIIDFDWQVSLGGEPISLAELQTLAKLKSPLVKYRGQWVQLNAEEIQEALGFWQKRSGGRASLGELVKMSLGAATAGDALAVESVIATGWIGDFLNQLEGRASYAEQPKPKGLRATLRPYQLRGYSWLSFLCTWGLGACLADDMGLGKTIQVLTLIQKEWEAGTRRPVLVICPTSVVGNWQKEAARFTPRLTVMVHHGIERRKGGAFQAAAERKAVVISSYSLLHRDLEALKEVQWGGVVLDEAQNVKNAETKQSKAARSLSSGYRLALTGTPVENNVGDLWSIMEFLNPGLLGSQSEFKRKFFLPIQTAGDLSASKQLRRLTGPFILRRLKTDKTIISDLPEKMEMKVFCTLTKEQASLYQAVVNEATETLAESEGMQRKGLVLATLSKLKQVCNHPAQFLKDNSALPNRSGKLARLTEMLEEIQEVGERALIFTQFREMGDIIRRHVQETFGREVLFLHGAVTKKGRDQMVERFQNDKDAPHLFILSLKAGGTGLNLTSANHVFHFDRWWNPAVENQATDRAFRIGQAKNVQVHKYLCVGTLEEKIDEMIERKKAIASSVVGAGEKWLTELSTEQLKELFTLSQEAVVE
ncbi:MAG: DEAD/DEAH box helicase [Pyrinomonadaceae bacterium]